MVGRCDPILLRSCHRLLWCRHRFPVLEDLLPALKGSAVGRVVINLAKEQPVWRFPKVHPDKGATKDALEDAMSALAIDYVRPRIETVPQVTREAARLLMIKAIGFVETRREGIILSPQAQSTSADSMVM